MRHLRLFAFFVLAVTFLACQKNSKTEAKTETRENWKTIDNIDYSIQYPSTFDLDKSAKMGTSFILFSKKTSPQDHFRENINLVIQDLSGQNIGFDKYVKISEEQIKTVFEDGNLITSKMLSDKNKNFQELVYTGKLGKLSLKWKQFIWVQNQKAYVLTLSCESNQYDKYVSIGEDIMKTFIIK